MKMKQYTFLKEGWFSNLLRGPKAKTLEEAKNLYIKHGLDMGRMGMYQTYLSVTYEHFRKISEQYPQTRSIINNIAQRIDAMEINTMDDYAIAVVGFCQINVLLFKKFGPIYCDNRFKYLVSEL